MSFKDYLKENSITEEKLSKEEVWKAAQSQLITDFVSGFIPLCLSQNEIEQIINKIYERA